MEFNEFKVMMIGLSKAIPKYRVDFSDAETLKIWFGSMQEIDTEQLRTACRLAVNTLDDFPSIKTLKALCKGNIQDPAEIGQYTANKIGEAISRFGGYRAMEAKEWLGDLAWETVKRHGGWWDLCNIDSMQDLEFLKKDMQKTAESIYRNYEAFGSEKKIGLPEKVRTEPIEAPKGTSLLTFSKEI